MREASCRVVPYSVETDLEGYCARGLQVEEGRTHFELWKDGSPLRDIDFPGFGRHNVANAVAALAVAIELGVSAQEAAEALLRYRGVKRRQEVRGEVAGVTVIDDFAHHPTAVRETLGALASRYPGRRVVAVFEPRSNTSRRDVFQRDYANAFAGAGRVVVAEVSDQPIYSATGEVTARFSATRLASDLRKSGTDAVALDGVDAIVDDLVEHAEAGDVIVTLSNGSFGGIWEALLSRLSG